MITPRPRLDLAERNFRNHVRHRVPHTVQVYGQDIVDLLAELDRLRAAAIAALDHADPVSPTNLRVLGAGRG